MKPRDLLPALALLAALAAVAAAQPSPPARAGVELHGPLDKFNMTGCFYRGMNITLYMNVTNLLTPVAPPPWCPTLAPLDGYLTCRCRLLPVTWWPNATWLLVLPPNATWSTALDAGIPGNASLGVHGAGYRCLCSWSDWCINETTTTVWVTFGACATNTIIKGNTTTTSVICYTTSTPSTTTTTTTVTKAESYVIEATRSVTVLPRKVNMSLLPVELSLTPLGNSSGTVTAKLYALVYNLGRGMTTTTVVTETLINRSVTPPKTYTNTTVETITPIPMEKGMLYLSNLTVAVSNNTVINCTGYCAPAQELGPGAGPSAVGEATLTLTPRSPGATRSFNLTICFDEDVNATATHTCYETRTTVGLPWGWRKVVYIADDCSVVGERWEVVKPYEAGIETVLVEDRVKPRINVKAYCVAASAGACEPVRLLVLENGSLVASRTGRGTVTWCPVEPGTYTAMAIDYFNNTASKVLTVTWSTGPPPALRRALLGLAAVLLAAMAALYILAGGGWPLRGP